jgi:hypothetical protein
MENFGGYGNEPLGSIKAANTLFNRATVIFLRQTCYGVTLRYRIELRNS